MSFNNNVETWVYEFFISKLIVILTASKTVEMCTQIIY